MPRAIITEEEAGRLTADGRLRRVAAPLAAAKQPPAHKEASGSGSSDEEGMVTVDVAARAPCNGKAAPGGAQPATLDTAWIRDQQAVAAC